MICTRCGTSVPSDAAACPRCGTLLTAQGAARATQGTATQGAAGPYQSGAGAAQRAWPQQPAAHSAGPAFRLDASRLTRGDKITGIGTLVLLISLFLPWYGVNLLGISAEVDGLTGRGYLYIVLIVSLTIIAYLGACAGFEELPARLPLSHRQRLLAASGLNAALVLLAFLFRPGFSGWRFGAFAGILAAAAAVAPLVGPAARSSRARA